MRFLAPYQSTILSLVRIASAYMFILHGTTKAFGFPSAPQYPLEWMSIFGAAAALELVGGALLLLGLFTRPVAFILSGQMAVAYFMFHAGADNFLYPLLNHGAEPAGGVIDDHHVAVGEMVPATCLRGPVDRDVARLDGDACLCAVLHQAGQLEELAELDASRH